MCHRSLLAVVGVVLSAVGGGSLRAQANLEVREEPIKRAVPLSRAPSHEVSFMLFASGGTCTQAEATVLGVQDPLGTSMPTDALDAAPIESVTSTGAPVKLTVEIAHFARHGDFPVLLLMNAMCGAERRELTVNLSLTHPPAALNAAELTGRTLELTRWNPLGSASGSVPMRLIETSGTSDVRDLRVTAQGMYSADATAIVPGRVEVTGAPETIDAGSAAELQVKLTGLKARSMKTRLVVASPSLAERPTIELGVVVSDAWVWALLFILLGVLCAYALSTIVTKGRPHVVNRLRIHELRLLIEDLEKQCAGNQTAKDQLELQRRALRLAENRNEVGDVTGAGTALDEIEKALKGISCPSARNFLTGALEGISERSVDLKRKLKRYDRIIGFVSVGVATVIGLQALYFGHQWGGVEDMIVALVWGFGVDASVRGFGAVFTRLNAPLQ